jgi:hypothetical protein
MKRFSEFCLKVKVFAVEAVTLAGFLGVLGLVLYLEWHHLVLWAHYRAGN